MKRISIIGSVLMAIMAMGAVAASSAMANCELTLGYCVLGKPLGGGQTQGIEAKAAKEFVLKGEFLGIKSVTKCKKLKLNAAKAPVIVGGMPGTGRNQLVEFAECSATLGGSACNAVSVSNASTETIQVMIDHPTSLLGKLATYFVPANGGTTFSTIKLTECGLLGSQEATVTGTTAALDTPVLTEAETGNLVYKEGAEEITEILHLDGKALKVGLKFGGNVATLDGEATVSLVSKEPWGVF